MLFWAQSTCAQKSKTNQQNEWRFQIEYGCNYSNFPDKNRSFSGLAIFSDKFYSTFIYDRSQPVKDNYLGYSIGVKAIYRKKHILAYNSIKFASAVVSEVLKPAQYSQSYVIDALGYGYLLLRSKFNLSVHAQLCYRTGMERYFVHFNPSSPYQPNPTTGSLGYQKPWGACAGAQIDYHITNHIGVGLSAGYYVFPFEDAKLKASFLHLLNPTMEATTFPNKEIFHASLKVFYNFSLPKISLFKHSKN